MSKVVKYTGQLSNFVHYKDKYFYIDSRRTLDRGLEMMIFPANCFCEVTDWGNVLYEEHFTDIADMIARHAYLRNHVEDVIII